MPYIDKEIYEMIPRTTEILGGLECEMKAYQHPLNRMERGDKNPMIFETYREVALKGTLAHHEKEVWIRDEFDLPPIELDLTPNDKKLYAQVMANSARLTTMMDEVKVSFDNFRMWWDQFEPEPVGDMGVEKTMVYLHYENKRLIPKKSVKGTIDFIGVFDPDQMTEYAHDLLPLTEPTILLVDWKSGLSKQPTYEAQIQAYHWTSYKIDIWKDLPTWAKNIPVSTTGATVLCGKKPTQAQKQSGIGGAQFLRYDNLNTYKMWMKARDIFFAPQPIVRSHVRAWAKEWRESYGCNFCPHTYSNYCPVNQTSGIRLDDMISLMKGEEDV